MHEYSRVLAAAAAVLLIIALAIALRRSPSTERFRASKCYDCEHQTGDLGYPMMCFDCEAQMRSGRRPSGQSTLDYQLGMGGGAPKMFAGA
jgi:hypothetical protein